MCALREWQAGRGNQHRLEGLCPSDSGCFGGQGGDGRHGMRQEGKSKDLNSSNTSTVSALLYIVFVSEVCSHEEYSRVIRWVSIMEEKDGANLAHIIK